MLKDNKIIVTGGNGFLGKYVVEKLIEEQVPKKNIFIPRSKEYNLKKEENIKRMFSDFPADMVIHLATTAKVMGYNIKHPGSIFYDNLHMGLNLMEHARLNKIKKFVIIGTALAYPKDLQIRIKEEDLWKGYPELANAPLGLASKTLLAQAQTYKEEYGFNSIYLIPANLYGPRDYFETEKCHVIPSFIKRFDSAIKQGKRTVENWGSGKASREFIYVEDAAEGIIKAIKNYNKQEPVNLGSGIEVSMKSLSEKIAKYLGFDGEILWDTSKLEGELRRCLDNSKAEKEFNFKAKTSFDEGLKKTIDWYKSSIF